MGIILWIIFGAVVGFIADYIDSSVHLGWVERVVVGIVGAVLGGTLVSVLTTGTLDISAAAGFNLVSIVVAVLGALVALFVYKRFVRKPAL